jgi:hypothetical protein
MASFARFSVVCSLALGCSPKVIDAVVEGESCCIDGGGDRGSTVETSVLDTGGEALPDASARKLLLHRYSFFNGQPGQTVVPDSMQSGPNASLFDAHLYNVQFAGDPFLALPGGSAAVAPAYVDLPNFLVSRLDAVTIEVWVEWAADADAWQRIFDFGEDFSGADLDAAPRVAPVDDPRARDGRSYLYLTPMSGGTLVPSVLRVAYLKPEDMVPRMSGVTIRETSITNTTALGAGLHQLAVTIDANQKMSLYVDGTQHIGVDQLLPGRLADIYDVNCWIGRSEFPVDPTFHGNLYEFRIYSVALTQAQILSNHTANYTTPAIE